MNDPLDGGAGEIRGRSCSAWVQVRGNLCGFDETDTQNADSRMVGLALYRLAGGSGAKPLRSVSALSTLVGSSVESYEGDTDRLIRSPLVSVSLLTERSLPPATSGQSIIPASLVSTSTGIAVTMIMRASARTDDSDRTLLIIFDRYSEW